MTDIKSVVRLVDDFEDNDYKTRKTCPGTVFGKALIPVAIQRERRIIGKGRIKNLIFVLEGTRELWYKKSYCSAGVVAMGFSVNSLEYNNHAKSMQDYAELFLDPNHIVKSVGTPSKQWLAMNNFELVENRGFNFD